MELCRFLLTRQVYSQKSLLCRSSHEVLTKMPGSVARGKTSSSGIILFPVYLKRRISQKHFLLNLFVINKLRFFSENFLVRKR